MADQNSGATGALGNFRQSWLLLLALAAMFAVVVGFHFLRGDSGNATQTVARDLGHTLLHHPERAQWHKLPADRPQLRLWHARMAKIKHRASH